MLPHSVYGFFAFGGLTLLLLAAGYAFHSGALSRFLAYLAVSSSTAAVACMIDVGVLLGPHRPSQLADDIALVERKMNVRELLSRQSGSGR